MAIKKDPKSGKWIAQIGSGKQGTRRKKRFKLKSEAEKWMAEQLLQGPIDSSGPESKEDELPMLIQAYFETLDDKSLHYQSFAKRTINRIVEACNIRRIDEITIQRIEPYKRKGTGKRMLNQELSLFKTFINFAEREGFVQLNPIRNLKPVPTMKTQRKALTNYECQEILKSAKVHSPLNIYPMIQVFLTLGLRRAELCTLEWTDFEFDRNIVHIQDKPHINIYGKPFKVKWGSFRDLPLRDDLKSLLLKLPRTHTLVFPSRIGTPRMKNLNRDFRLAIRDAQIPNLKRITPHVLRHTFISQLLQYGKQDIKTVSYLAGHTQIQTTQGYVTMLGDFDTQKSAVESIPKYIED